MNLNKKISLLFSTVFLFSIVGCNFTNAQPIPTEKSQASQTLEPSATSMPSLTPTKTVTPTRTLTPTPRPTVTPIPTSTPVPGAFDAPLRIGESVTLEALPEEYRKEGASGLAEFKFELLEVKFGDDAKQQAKQNLNWVTYQEPIENQEYFAIRGKLYLLWSGDNNQVEVIYPYFHFTLRYEEGGKDIWCMDYTDKVAEGYPPIEGEFWIYFLIRSGTEPYLYFQPNLIASEHLGIRTFGAYFRLFD